MKLSGRDRQLLGSLERGDLPLSVDSEGLTLRALDYHCPPLHLRREELRRLGFVLLPFRSTLMRPFADLPSAVLDAASRRGRADDMTAVALRLTR